MRDLSNWRAVRVWELGVERELRRRHVLRLHGFFIGLVVLAAMWLAAYLQSEFFATRSLALRYLITLGIGYLGYLVVLRVWAAALLRRSGSATGRADLSFDIPLPGRSIDAAADVPRIVSGGGGDFGGGGASADFGVADLAGAADAGDAGAALGDAASGAIQIAAAADDGAVVVVPVVAVFLIGLAVVFGAGSLLLLYFGWDVLLAVAVELAFGYVSGTTAIRVAREGWLSAAVRLTWKPLLGAVVCAVLLGALIDYFIPAAHSLPQALRVLHSTQRR